jgi:hypothetical protein
LVYTPWGYNPRLPHSPICTWGSRECWGYRPNFLAFFTKNILLLAFLTSPLNLHFKDYPIIL